MELDINYLISFFKKNTKNSSKSEIGEQDAGTGSGGSTGASMPKWEDVVGGPARGKANMLGKKGEIWTTGAKRAVANQVW